MPVPCEPCDLAHSGSRYERGHCIKRQREGERTLGIANALYGRLKTWVSPEFMNSYQNCLHYSRFAMMASKITDEV